MNMQACSLNPVEAKMKRVKFLNYKTLNRCMLVAMLLVSDSVLSDDAVLSENEQPFVGGKRDRDIGYRGDRADDVHPACGI